MIAVAGDTIAQQKTAWTARADKATFEAVVVQVGLNDLDPAEAASVAIARLQDLVDTINADVSVPVYIAQMTPCRARLITVYGGVNGPISYQKWLDINAAIAGTGGTPITGVDGRITSHATSMNDGAGNLLAAYDSGDGIHPNNKGRHVNAAAWYAAISALL
jgi:lysophospholipase L1-like esterase